jgi:hypothetical protein
MDKFKYCGKLFDDFVGITVSGGRAQAESQHGSTPPTSLRRNHTYPIPENLSAKHWAAESRSYGPGTVADPKESTYHAPATGSLAGLGGGVKQHALPSIAEDGVGFELFDELNRDLKREREKNVASRPSSPVLLVSPGEPTRPLAGPLQFVAATRALSPALLVSPGEPTRPLAGPLPIVQGFGFQGDVLNRLKKVSSEHPENMLVIQPTSSGKCAYAQELARRPGKF